MSEYLMKFLSLMDLFLSNEISATEFDNKFSKLFYDAGLISNNPKEFDIIEELWGWLDRYQPKKNIRNLDDTLINENQLKEIINDYHKKLVILNK